MGAEAKRGWALALLLVCFSLASATQGKKEQVTHKQTFLSRAFEQSPGDVVDNFYSLEIPEGHIAIRSFDAEVVDENGNSVPLTEVYLHHWVVLKYYVKKGHRELVSSVPKSPAHSDETLTGHFDMRQPQEERIHFQEGADAIPVKTQGSCSDNQNRVYFAVGSETRHTNTTLPPPYGLVKGDPEVIPEGYEESWILNIHAIDTRGAVDATSCLECLCEAYGVTEDAYGHPLPEGYRGGLNCCYDKTHCAVKEGANGLRRKLYMKYVMTWVDWDQSVVPVRTYMFDATDPRTSLSEDPHCKVEYEVTQCSKGSAANECIDQHHSIGTVPVGGDVVLARLHQHAGGLGGMLYYKNGPVVCSSDPIYGKGTEPGDEAGYVVGMTVCYPEPGSIYLESWKELQFDAYYSNEKAHTGVMSVFFVLIADPVVHIAEVID